MPTKMLWKTTTGAVSAGEAFKPNPKVEEISKQDLIERAGSIAVDQARTGAEGRSPLREIL